MQYPQYRKYKGLETYFILLSADEFEEIKVVGTKYMVSKVKAEQFPERLLIQDMLNNEGERWDVLQKEELHKILTKIKETKTLI